MTEGPDGPEEPQGQLMPSGAPAVGGSIALGLVSGWLLHPVSARMGAPPVVTWLPAITLLFVAAVLAATAWLTWRIVHVRREWLEPHRAVNRLVLAKSCVLVGGLAAGGYLGYALSWVGDQAELGGERMLHSVVAGVGGLAVVGAAVALERACRVRSDGEEP